MKTRKDRLAAVKKAAMRKTIAAAFPHHKTHVVFHVTATGFNYGKEVSLSLVIWPKGNRKSARTVFYMPATCGVGLDHVKSREIFLRTATSYGKKLSSEWGRK